jgi:uncharacterized membrane protein YkvA (DUF1232 family)
MVNRLIDWFAFPYSLYLLVNNPDISSKVKLKAGLILAVLVFYFLDPMDLVPDIVPLLGWLDDLVIVPLAMAVTGKVVPEINISDLRKKARSDTRRIIFWALMLVIAMMLISLSTIGLLIYLAIRYWF